jgi:hypothetical protein
MRVALLTNLKTRGERTRKKHIDSMFLYVRQQQLATDAADRILLSITIVLGMRIESIVLRNALILEDLDTSLKVDKLVGRLCDYGEVKHAAIVADSDFGMCRFYTEAAANPVMAGLGGWLLLHRQKQANHFDSHPFVVGEASCDVPSSIFGAQPHASEANYVSSAITSTQHHGD